MNTRLPFSHIPSKKIKEAVATGKKQYQYRNKSKSPSTYQKFTTSPRYNAGKSTWSQWREVRPGKDAEEASGNPSAKTPGPEGEGVCSAVTKGTSRVHTWRHQGPGPRAAFAPARGKVKVGAGSADPGPPAADGGSHGYLRSQPLLRSFSTSSCWTIHLTN